MYFFELYCFFIHAQILIIILVYTRPLYYHDRKAIKYETELPVSVIIAAHNELPNLRKLLPALLQQKHKDFEIIIADDRSSDGSDVYLERQAILNKKLRYVRIDEVPVGKSPKKNALEKAIALAQHDVLLFTDADCIPLTFDWLRNMAAGYDSKKEIVLGVSLYEQRKGWLNRFIQYETLITALQYTSFALIGLPFMGVGRNLSYKKSLFQKSGGFGAQMKIMSGDDDLMINKMSDRKNVAVVLQPESQTISAPKETFADWYVQKKRHLSVGKFYSLRNKLMLGFITFSHISVYFLSLILWGLNVQVLYVFILFISRVVILMLVLSLAARKFASPVKWWLTPIMDLIYIVYQISVGFVSLISKHIRWK
ncbi:glycosyltransferase [Limibacter armeniacum]|uniref:glycosyltransferase n=1 Tax=Limibacter armeniacum TaxID=466084 RepID=UPI002FE5A440